MYKSQYQQDLWLDNHIFHGKRNGTFVDIGAYDGFDISNTFHFDTVSDWEGICIEPNPLTFKELEKNRNCILENCAIGDEEGELDFVAIYGGGASGSGFDDPTGKVRETAITETARDGATWEIMKVPTFRLDTILDKYNYKIVDYCSIDVEGFEINVVKSINWNNYYIQYLTVEKNISINEVTEHLALFSYTPLRDIGGDLIFKLNR